MLGRKKGMRDINRGMEDIRASWAQMKSATAKSPQDRIGILEDQYERHIAEARKNRAKAKGVLNGPARLRMAERSEAMAEEVRAQIDQIKVENPGDSPPPPPSAPAGWRPDPNGQPNLLRYWDGTQWTEHTAPAS